MKFKLESISRKFNPLKEQSADFGYKWLIGSLFLNKQECLSLFEMTNATNGKLIYRASVDGFESKSFHSKCDGKENTVTIVKTNLNFVFGGFTKTKWFSVNGSTHDSEAFIFSLRRNGITVCEKYIVRDPRVAINYCDNWGPLFGCYNNGNKCDIAICNNSNIETGSYSRFGTLYELPQSLSYIDIEHRESYLAGSFNSWLTTDIEVYQIT